MEEVSSQMDKSLEKQQQLLQQQPSKCWEMNVRQQDLQTRYSKCLSGWIQGVKVRVRMQMYCGWSEISVLIGVT